MNHDEGPPTGTREPPWDPDYDTPGAGKPIANVEAERAVLGALLTDPTLATHLATHLEPRDFYRPEHEAIWTAIQTLAATGTPADPITLAGTLNGQLTRIGGPAYLVDLMGACPTPAQAPAYAKIVRDAARLRAARTAVTRLNQTITRGAGLDDVDHTISQLVDTIDQQFLRFGPRDTSTASGLKDLSWLNGGTPPVVPPPVHLHRTDGHAIFYAGQVNGLIGDPETAKTWIAQAAGVEALNQGGTFAMIDVDHNGPNHTAARLILLGARMEHVADPTRFRYYEPEDAEELRAAVDDITTFAPKVLVIDSIGEVFPMLGVNTNDGDEMTSALRLVCTRPATAGACVITIDHLPKGVDARATGFAIGSIAKKRMIRGSYLRVEAKVKPVPGGVGIITMRIEKDSSGELRRSSNGGYAGTFTLDSTQAHVTTWHIGRDEGPKNDDGTFRPTALMERISRYIEDNDQCTFTDIKDRVTAKDKWLRDAINLLVTEGFVARFAGARRAQLHHSIAPYRETEDDHVEQPI